MNVLVINAGSSSLKYQLINMATQQVLCKGQVERIGIDGSFLKQKGGAEEADIHAEIKDHNDAIEMVLKALTDPKHGVVKSLEEIDAVGHRVLHGGEKFADPVLVNDQVIRDLESIIDLGPLHMPANISGIKACQKAMPVPQVAVFDTGFHQTMPPKAYMYGLPYEAYEKHKVRRYGFHVSQVCFPARGGIARHGKREDDYLPPWQRQQPVRHFGRQMHGYLHGTYAFGGRGDGHAQRRYGSCDCEIHHGKGKQDHRRDGSLPE